MSEQKPDSPKSEFDCVSDSPYTVIIYDDGEGDATVRPIPPERRAYAIAERDRIQTCLAARKAQETAANNE